HWSDMSTATRRIIGLGIAALIVLAAVIWLQQLLHRKTVTLEPAMGITITFGVPNADTPSFNKVLAKTSTRSTLKVEEGFYLAQFTQAGHQTKYTYIHLKGDQTITSPSLPYNSNRLADLLRTQVPLVNAQLKSNSATAGFTPGYEQIYGAGDWFAATLTSQGGATQRVILHKKDGVWAVVAGPALTFFIGDYPSIPSGVIRDINYH
ncbi:MAG TPA: hypothetical protein VN554_03225, partial [Verrucomicrobiae bacterium]|nr:hypothetical protein [Verrucomicrobiae bacterium]